MSTLYALNIDYAMRYIGGGSGHWIQDISNNGKVVVLEDGSRWEIHRMDRIDTSLWMPTDDITVKDKGPSIEYDYTLVNTEEDESAGAKLLEK